MRWDGTVGIGAPCEMHQRLVAELCADGCHVNGFPRWMRGLGLATALRPDAYRVNLDVCTLDVYEVVFASPISGAKLREYRSLAATMAGMLWSMRVYRVRPRRRELVAGGEQNDRVLFLA